MNDGRPKPRDSGRSPDDLAPDFIYRNILENVASGIMSLDAEGVITSFNAAATEIFDLTGETVTGRRFNDLFSHREGLDQFVDIIFEAIYDSTMVHQRVVEVTLGGEQRSLSVATTYLKEERDGEVLWMGIVVMFNDISEIRELRETELRLAKEVEAQHAELRKAYLDLEDTNQKLGAASKKIHAVRMGAALLVPVLFVAIGLYFWDTRPEAEPPPSGSAASSAWRGGVPEEARGLVVEPRRVSASVTMIGRLAPRREVEVSAPMEGKVGAVHVRTGQQVARGQPLLDMDVADLQISRREAEVAYLKARDRVDKFGNWSDHPEVSRVRKAVSQSRIKLESRRNRLEETTFLLERGIIPASEHEAAEREHRNQLLDLQTAEQDLQSVLAMGPAELKVAQLELENARTQLKGIEETLRKAAVTAPAAGVVMHPKPDNPERARLGETDTKLVKGAFVERGDRLLTIGDLSGMVVVGYVDEVDVTRIRLGHAARVVGDAFPGIVLRGEVDRVSSQAIPIGEGRRQPLFEVSAVVGSLTEEQRRLLRLGMSARVEVVVYEKKDALLVPIEAVETREGRSLLWVRDPDSGEARTVEVVVGVTTLDSVEIVGGLAAGDEVLMAGPWQ